MPLRLPESRISFSSKPKYRLNTRYRFSEKPTRRKIQPGDERLMLSLPVPPEHRLHNGYEFLPFKGKEVVRTLLRKGLEVVRVTMSADIVIHFSRGRIESRGVLSRSDIKHIIGFSCRRKGMVYLYVQTRDGKKVAEKKKTIPVSAP